MIFYRRKETETINTNIDATTWKRLKSINCFDISAHSTNYWCQHWLISFTLQTIRITTNGVDCNPVTCFQRKRNNSIKINFKVTTSTTWHSINDFQGVFIQFTALSIYNLVITVRLNRGIYLSIQEMHISACQVQSAHSEMKEESKSLTVIHLP